MFSYERREKMVWTNYGGLSLVVFENKEAGLFKREEGRGCLHRWRNTVAKNSQLGIAFSSQWWREWPKGEHISALQDYYGTDIFCSQKLSLLEVGGISALKTSLLISFSVKRKTSAVVSGLRKLRLERWSPRLWAVCKQDSAGSLSLPGQCRW